VNCLVTGAAGFIGSHLVEALLREGYHVVGFDNFSVGRYANLESIDSNPNFKFVIGDVRSSSQLERLDCQFDYIFHLAALADIVPSIENPSEYMEVNVRGTTNVLQFARSCKVKKFLYAASSSCYGIADEIPTPERARVSPEYPYALSKYLGELCALHWSKVYDIPTVSLRLFNVYGPRARTSGTYGAVFGVFLAQRLANKPLTVVGDGTQTRDFTFVSDVVDAFIVAAQSGINSEVFNVGSGGTYSINHLVGLIGGPIINIPKRPGEPDCTFADISKIKTMLDWTPKISFNQGVSALLDQLEVWKDAPVWEVDSIYQATKTWFRYLGRESNE
jgi:UDP-glucose 4-epimerase